MTPRIFRLPRSAYLAVLFLLFCSAPLALAENASTLSGAAVSPRLLILLIPILAIAFIARTATFVDGAGIRVRAIFGSRTLAWGDIRGLSVSGNSVYAVVADGGVRLPCVRMADLAELARHSEGHVPQLRDPVRRFAPSRRPR